MMTPFFGTPSDGYQDLAIQTELVERESGDLFPGFWTRGITIKSGMGDFPKSLKARKGTLVGA